MSRQFTAPVLLPADPTTALQAATKQYVDTFQGASPYPLSAYGLISASFHLDAATSLANTVSVNTIEIYRLWVPPNRTLSGAATFVTTAGTTPGATGASGFALYSDDGATQLAITATDYAIFTTAGLRSKAFNSPVAATPLGYWARVAMIHTCSVVPKFVTGFNFSTQVLSSAITGTHRRGVFATATTAFPATFNPATYGQLDNPALFLAVY